MKKPRVIVILGPTASGKSDLAVLLAKHLASKKFEKYGIKGAEIISADSRQIYKGLNIGTGKITKKEMKGVPHHLLDVASPKRQFTVSDFKKLAEEVIEKIIAKDKMPIVCGGTGFYIDALLGSKQIPEVPPNLELRKELEQKSTQELFEILQKLDPERAKNIDAKNPRRLVRAIEIARALGKVPPLHKDFAGQAKPESRIMKYEVCKIGIKIREEDLKNRINKRLEKRIRIGMISEAKRLHKNGLSYKRMREFGLEYRALADLLENKITKEELIARLQNEIWHYAKRQITYFKKDNEIIWLESKIKQVNKIVEKFLI